jgi:hypothetical protein
MSLKRAVLAMASLLLAAGLLVLFGVMDIALARWPVKTFRDRDRAAVDLTPIDTTVADLARLPRPDSRIFRGSRRVAAAERTVYRVRGLLQNAHYESDGDLHMTIADPRDPSVTLIVEIPNPLFSVGSGLAGAFREERREVEQHRRARGEPIEVTGIGFFDYRSHMRSGGAENGIELHPVIRVVFPKGS